MAKQKPPPVYCAYVINARDGYRFNGTQEEAAEAVAKARANNIWLRVGETLLDPNHVIGISPTFNANDPHSAVPKSSKVMDIPLS